MRKKTPTLAVFLLISGLSLGLTACGESDEEPDDESTSEVIRESDFEDWEWDGGSNAEEVDEDEGRTFEDTNQNMDTRTQDLQAYLAPDKVNQVAMAMEDDFRVDEEELGEIAENEVCNQYDYPADQDQQEEIRNQLMNEYNISYQTAREITSASHSGWCPGVEDQIYDQMDY